MILPSAEVLQMRRQSEMMELRKRRRLWERATTIDVGENIIPEEYDAIMSSSTAESSQLENPKLRRGYSVTYTRSKLNRQKSKDKSRSESLSDDLWRSLIRPQPFWFQK